MTLCTCLRTTGLLPVRARVNSFEVLVGLDQSAKSLTKGRKHELFSLER